MRTFIPIAAALAIIASSASAQNPPANSGPGNNAVNSPSTTNPGAPVEGRNSFTEGQARSRIEANGFADVSGLQKDDRAPRKMPLASRGQIRFGNPAR
jgi:hypothetical protein